MLFAVYKGQRGTEEIMALIGRQHRVCLCKRRDVRLNEKDEFISLVITRDFV